MRQHWTRMMDEPTTQLNALYAGMMLEDSVLLVKTSSPLETETPHYELNYNQALGLLTQKRFAAGATLLKPWIDDPNRGEANLLYSYFLFQQDSLTEALSRTGLFGPAKSSEKSPDPRAGILPTRGSGNGGKIFPPGC